MSLLLLEESAQTNSVNNYIPQIIGIFGTILGTILGWLLRYLQDNLGGIEIKVDSYVHYRDDNQYLLNFKLFICNHSMKNRYLKNFEIYFTKKRKRLHSCQLKENERIDNFVGINSKQAVNIIMLKWNEPRQIVLSVLLPFEKVSSANKILMTCVDENKRTRKIKIAIKESIENCPKYSGGKLFPQ